MTMNILRYAVLALLISIFGRAAAVNLSDSLSEQLATAATSADSISLLYNIFDVSEGKAQYDALEQLYQVADRAGNENVILDVLRLGANLNATSDSLLNVFIERAERLSDSDNKQATILFIKVRNKAKQIRSLPEEMRDKNLRQYLSDYKEIGQMDNYQHIEYLFSLCSYLRLATDGELLINYLAELQTLIDKLPNRELYLRSLFYTQAAVNYLDNGMHEPAVAANKTLLGIIDELEEQYKAAGRIYRNYDRSKYICYRRLLRCHDALTPEEIDIYYNRLLSLLDSSPDLMHDYEQRQRPVIYYLMAKKRYAEVIPLIKRQFDDKFNTREEYRYLVESMIEAADSVGDDVNLLAALKLNNALLKERIEEKAAESYKELQIVYEVNELKQENNDLAMANRVRVAEKHRALMTFAVIGIVVLVVAVVILGFSNRRNRKLVKDIENSNRLLLQERDNLQRTQKDLIEARDKAKRSERFKMDFVNNMSHELLTPLNAIVEYSNLIADCVDDERHAYVRRFADLVSLNSDLLVTLVNDMLDLPSLENSRLSLNAMSSSLKEICKVSIDSVRKRIAPGVSFVFVNENDPDAVVKTDPQRVEQVLIHILTNAAKFTEKGAITFEYKFSDDRKAITFTVTDTGIGIPRGKEELIFSRFAKLDSSTQGNGLGLYISRLLASLLKGKLVVDENYRTGARFMFTIPVV